jgi:hypothetical protein
MSDVEVRRRRRGGGLSGLIGLLVVIWLVIGAVAAFQRDYFKSGNGSCGDVGTIVVTIIAGPLNYVGLNPKVKNCNVPQPSK